MTISNSLLTLEDYHAICDLPENEGRILELIDGEIVEKMASFEPSQIASRINGFAFIFLLSHPIGYLTGEAGGYVMAPGHVYNPDVGFISKARLPDKPEREAPIPPDFAVEVKSPSDRKRAMRRKAERYLEFGTKLVWLVFPEEQLVEVYMPDQDVMVVGIDGVLDGGTILPGFSLAVRQIFE